MTREQKLEAMARAWCEFNGWVPDHRPLQFVVQDWGMADGEKIARPIFSEEPGPPLWRSHLKAMDHVLKSIELK